MLFSLTNSNPCILCLFFIQYTRPRETSKIPCAMMWIQFPWTYWPGSLIMVYGKDELWLPQNSITYSVTVTTWILAFCDKEMLRPLALITAMADTSLHHLIDRVRVQELWTYTSGKKSKTLKYSISIIHRIKMKWSYHLVVHYGRNILYLLKQMVS